MKKKALSSENQGKRIGFVLANIHFGTALDLWPHVARKAAESTGSFFVFAGGKIDDSQNSDHLRNSIYSLANPNNLDGLISWSSSLAGAVSVSELEKFHGQFSGIPFITIGHKISGHPYIEFDAYSGMKSLVLHFLKNHDCRRIAFLRGPAEHHSAEERYRAFRDAIRDAGIFDEAAEKLISSPCDWKRAEKAAAELFEERSLVPGKDFDALLAASDLMALSAVAYFSERGFSAGRDYLVGGFNNSMEGRFSNPQFTTVNAPQRALGLEAVSMLSQILDGREVEDRILPTYPIIRESCGCAKNHSSGGSGEFLAEIKNQEQFRSEFFRIFHADSSPRAERERMEMLLDEFFSGAKGDFFDILDKFLESYLDGGGELSAVFSAMSLVGGASFLKAEFSQKVVRAVGAMLPRVQERVMTRKMHFQMQTNALLAALKNELLSVSSRREFLNVLKNHLPNMGIKNFSIVLYESEGESLFFGGLNISGATDFRTEEIPFDSKRLLPEDFESDLARGVFVVQPLFYGNTSLGYLLTNFCGIGGMAFEDLRGTVSSAIQNIFHFEELESAKRRAEMAEAEKTEFFANVGSDLCDPLRDLCAKVSQMESNVNEGLLDAEILGEQLIFLRSQIDAQLEKTETLVDLTRSQVDDLPMDKKLFDIRQILPASAMSGIPLETPLLFGDVERLHKAFESIVDSGGFDFKVEFSLDGAHVSFDSTKIDFQRPEFLLAEKIILLQYGDLLKSKSRSDALFPWPNISALPPVRSAESPLVFSLSKSLSQVFGKKVEQFSDERTLAAQTAESLVFGWSPDDAPIDEWVKVYSMRRSEVFFRTPLICFSRSLIGHNFLEVIEQKVKAQKSSAVLFVGMPRTNFGTWATDENSVSIPSMREFDKILTEITPLLIVFEKVSEDDIVKIRKNQKTVLVPILVLPESVLHEDEIKVLCSHPRVLMCNRCAAESEQFNGRIRALLGGDEILPPHTGALVKKAILYLNQNASVQIVRWKLASTVNVSEDYLTRIFHKEIGLSLWEYLNRYRVHIATKMLLETNDSIYEIAENSGFQDQAYFCRVFKKIYGIPPGKLRSKK